MELLGSSKVHKYHQFSLATGREPPLKSRSFIKSSWPICTKLLHLALVIVEDVDDR